MLPYFYVGVWPGPTSLMALSFAKKTQPSLHVLKNPDLPKAPKSEEIPRPSLFAWNTWTTSITLMTTPFLCLIPWVLPLLSTGQLINQREGEKLEKLFPLCFQHWLSALLMPRSVTNQRNYRSLGAGWCRHWLKVMSLTKQKSQEELEEPTKKLSL